LLDWIAQGGPEGLHVHKGRWGGTSHMTSQEERERERKRKRKRECSEFFKITKKRLQKELMEFGKLQKNNLMQFWMSTNFH
jgi:hypothetical protein